MKHFKLWTIATPLLLGHCILLSQITPINFSKVTIKDNFWTPQIDKVAAISLYSCVDYTENKTGRIRNFENAAKKGKKHEGIFFDDSDVYKALEAIAYSLKNHPDSLLEKTADQWIDKIASAQEPDGYINTYYSITGLNNRWHDMDKHEMYCAGHLTEAGIAYYNTTGKRKLLDVAIGMIEHIDKEFRLANKPWISGHEEIELALVKLYRTTNDKKYLDLAEWLIEQRGHGYYAGKQRSTTYNQDDVPFTEQKQVNGHAVRAMYLYTGAADVAACKNDMKYLPALVSIWNNLVEKNIYITGGIGSTAKNEGFSKYYDLPNESAYCETCASVGMILWNQRMNTLTGDAKYIDVLEKTLYNGALSGLSFSGDHYFYVNPLASSGQHERQAWFGCACCPSNISRLIASIGNYIYAVSKEGIYVNLFITSKTDIPFDKNKIHIAQQHNYPWEGKITVTINSDKKINKKLYIRIPGWAQNQAIPTDLYQYYHPKEKQIKITINGVSIDYVMEKGYAIIHHDWDRNNDVIEIELPMTFEKVVANANVSEDINCVALQRGPLIYCFEHADNYGKVKNIYIPLNSDFRANFEPLLFGGITTLNGSAPVMEPTKDGTNIQLQYKTLKAIPYYLWANRGKGEMQIWMPSKIMDIDIHAVKKH